MNNRIIEFIIITSGVLGVIVFGILMVLLSRWAGSKNAALSKGTNYSQINATKKALSEGKFPFFSSGFWTGNLSMTETIFGRLLALLVIAVVLVFLGFAFYAVLKII